MSRAEKESAYWRMKIKAAQLTDSFINRVPVYVTYDEETATERAVHLPLKKFWPHLT